MDLIVGTSAGAMIGGAYASGLTPREIQEKIDTYLRSPEFSVSALKSIGMSVAQEPKDRFGKATSFLKKHYYTLRTFFKPSLLPKEDFESLIHYFIPDIDIGETRIPFLAVTTDLITGEQVVFSEGSLRQAVLASCAVPGAVEPIRQV